MKEIAIGIKEARRDLEAAENIFNFVTSKEDIDEAIFRMLAAETKINKLVKLAKKEGGN